MLDSVVGAFLVGLQLTCPVLCLQVPEPARNPRCLVSPSLADAQTQNVTDVASSKAFMMLAARFPAPQAPLSDTGTTFKAHSYACTVSFE